MTATIKPTSPRHQAWIDVFGTDTITVTNDGPEGCGYLLDPGTLTVDQHKRLVRYLGSRWQLTIPMVNAKIARRGGVAIASADVEIVDQGGLFA